MQKEELGLQRSKQSQNDPQSDSALGETIKSNSMSSLRINLALLWN